MNLTIKHAEHITLNLSSDTQAQAFFGRIMAPIERETGTHWPEQNGWYAGVCCAPDGTRWHLVVPDAHINTFKEVAWGERGKELEGAGDNYDGQANTTAMADSGNELAKNVRELGDDLYLPSRSEALLMFSTLKDQIGDGYMWTSTQYSDYSAWSQNFSSGLQGTDYRDDEFRAVPVRRLIL